MDAPDCSQQNKTHKQMLHVSFNQSTWTSSGSISHCQVFRVEVLLCCFELHLKVSDNYTDNDH